MAAEDAGCAATARTILALYDGSREPEARSTRLHRYAEMPLNHKGYRLVYHDVGTGPADAAALAGRVGAGPIAATLSWFDAALAQPESFAAWADAFRDTCGGRPRTVILGHTGLSFGTGLSAAWGAYLGRAGLRSGGGAVSLGVTASILSRDPLLGNGETGIVLMPGRYPQAVAGPDARPLLSAGTEYLSVDLAVIGAHGGYADDIALIAEDWRGAAFWRLDPFAFFGAALDTGLSPVPDATTRNGRRIFFSTLRGEGWTDALPGGTFGEDTELAAEVVERRFVAPYPDLPVTIAVATGDIDPALGRAAAERGRSAAERLAALPHVDLGTLGRSLVYRWSAFAPGGQRTVSRATDSLDAGYVAAAVRRLGETAAGGPRGSSLDRRHDEDAFDLGTEIDGAIAEIAALGPRDDVPPLLWSGDARPFEDALGRVEDIAAPAMGGEGGGIDILAPSLTSLGPLTAPVGDRLQVLDAFGDQGVYDDDPPWPGFLGLQETLDHTEAPRRLKPYHLNYTAGVALTFGGRMAVKTHLDHARADVFIPIPARAYEAIVRGWQDFDAVPDGDLAWRILDRGALQTVRFDATGALALDIASSVGVLGSRRLGEALYIALDPEVETPRVALVPGAAPSGLAETPEAPMLAGTRAEVAGMAREGCVTRVNLSRVFAGEGAWWTRPGESVTAVLSRGGAALSENTVVADEDGMARLPLPDLGGGAADLRLTAACSRR